MQYWGLQPSLTPVLEVTWNNCGSRHLFCWAQQRLPAGIKEKQGDGGSWGREKFFQPPAPHWNPQLSLVSKILQHWNTIVRESVTFLALKMVVRSEETTEQTLSHGCPSPQSKARRIQAGKSALRLPRIAEVSYLPDICTDCTYGQSDVQKSLQVWNVWDFRCPIFKLFSIWLLKGCWSFQLPQWQPGLVSTAENRFPTALQQTLTNKIPANSEALETSALKGN